VHLVLLSSRIAFTSNDRNCDFVPQIRGSSSTSHVGTVTSTQPAITTSPKMSTPSQVLSICVLLFIMSMSLQTTAANPLSIGTRVIFQNESKVWEVRFLAFSLRAVQVLEDPAPAAGSYMIGRAGGPERWCAHGRHLALGIGEVALYQEPHFERRWARLARDRGARRQPARRKAEGQQPRYLSSLSML
jgi:hypothetical protein